ncbi:hypothetical protein GGR21_002447 [Dysgonomonas hofstadii]|uniref:Uncharacterized protein n=1 Tax=Dysgonomonas hofstadii TaxID=637886 RepID=A0A840CN53_9BACT|nr:hypothetical protein [Dysgonomonas hofstadii]MBB4036541.1 hypothetical protein [Dysgonomonas hofstadii]
MKFENKYVLAYQDGKIVRRVDGTGEIFTPEGVTVELFDTEQEVDDFIRENGLEESEDENEPASED